MDTCPPGADDLVEPPVWGELGYGDWCIRLTEMGICSCEDCGGHLVDGSCLSCGCRHGVHEPTRHTRRRYPRWSGDADRCSHAARVQARDRLEQERQERARRRMWLEER